MDTSPLLHLHYVHLYGSWCVINTFLDYIQWNTSRLLDIWKNLKCNSVHLNYLLVYVYLHITTTELRIELCQIVADRTERCRATSG